MLIRFQNITKKYKSLVAISNISFEIYPSEIFGIVGPNGSGKTTTLSILLDLINPSAGCVIFNKSINKNDIGAYLEHTGFIPDLSVKENFKICCLIKGENNYNNFYSIIERLGLKEKENTPFRSLSLGEKQRLSIATTIVGNPKVIILDEPTNGLDPKGIIDIREMILELKEQGKTIILASHLLSEMQIVCDRVAVYNKGMLISLDTKLALSQKYGNLENAFIKLTSNDLESNTKN